MPAWDDPLFRERYLLKEVLRKYPDFDLGIDTREAALSQFFEDELANTFTNDRLLTYDSANPSVELIIESASRKIASVLGIFNWERFFERVRFGPGATVRHTRAEATVWGKLSGLPYVSSSAHFVMREILSRCPGWAFSLPGLVGDIPQTVSFDFVTCEYDRGTCVTKNAKTDRFIGIGPDGNVAAQLGLGHNMRERLAKCGVNLNDQTINQKLAREGSYHGRIATIDVKSASQSVTYGLVYKVLASRPHQELDPTWFRLMDCLRTENVLIDGSLHSYALFSPMGNGFTFELESLLFWGLTMAVCGHLGVSTESVSVYGDDITCPVEAVPLLQEVFSWCGFRLNMDKSFYTTSASGFCFRESCGKHYLNGTDVTPFYVDQALDTPDQIVLLANNLLRWSRLAYGRDGRVEEVYSWLVGHLHPLIRSCQIPFGDENDGLIVDFDECRVVQTLRIPNDLRSRNKTLLDSHFSGYRVKTFSIESRGERDDGRPGLSSWLYHSATTRFQASRDGKWWDKLVKTDSGDSGGLPPEVSLKFGSRDVVLFPHIGPWLSLDGAGSVSTDWLRGISDATRRWWDRRDSAISNIVYSRSTKYHPTDVPSRDAWMGVPLSVYFQLYLAFL